MANMFDENGNYNKTEWKPGDRITAGKLNKIEESLEAINNNDIERHKEADERLDALEEQKEAVEERFDELEDLVADNKTEVDTAIYEVHSKMDRLEQEMNDGIDTVEAIAHTVDDKIADADASMKAQVAEAEDIVDQGKANINAIIDEVEKISDLEDINAQLATSVKYQTINANQYDQGIQINSPNTNDKDYVCKTINVPSFALLINYNTYNSSRYRIMNNKIISQNADAIELNNPLTEEEGKETCKDVIISNNFLEAQGTDPDHTNGFAIGIAGTKNVVINGNVTSYSRHEGLHIEDTQENISVVGNVFANNYHVGLWLQDRDRGNGQYAKVPIINSNHFTQYENSKSDKGLYTIYDDFGNLQYANMRNNRIEGFAYGVYPEGSSQLDIDGCVFENCNVAVNVFGDVWGDVSVKGDTTTLAHFNNRGRMRGMIKSNSIYNPDLIFTFSDNCKTASIEGFSCKLEAIQKTSTSTNQYSYLKICKAPTYMKGIIDINITTESSNVYTYNQIELELDTVGNSINKTLYSEKSGILNVKSLTISSDGYLVLEIYHSTNNTIRSSITFKGIMVWGNNEVKINSVSNGAINEHGIFYLNADNYTTKIAEPKKNMQVRLPIISEGITIEIKVFVENPTTSDIPYYLYDRQGASPSNLYKKAGFSQTIKANSKYLLTLNFIDNFWIAESFSSI